MIFVFFVHFGPPNFVEVNIYPPEKLPRIPVGKYRLVYKDLPTKHVSYPAGECFWQTSFLVGGSENCEFDSNPNRVTSLKHIVKHIWIQECRN